MSWYGDGVSWYGDGMSWYGDDMSWYGDDMSWYGDGMSWYGDGVSWYGDGVSWYGDGVSWYGDSVSWYGDDMSWYGDMSLYGNGISWYGDDTSWYGNGISWYADYMSWYGISVIVCSRHGKKHSIMPSNINYRANIEALKQEGCTHVIATTACGSLDDKFFPGDFALPDQFIDRTTKRCSTFYDGAPDSPQGVCHIPMASPFCQRTRQLIKDVSWDMHFDVPVHDYATVVTIEGPRFSSQAESKLFQRWGGHVINMTTVPEVVLAKEAGLIYATIAMVTDYDSWRGSSEDHVSNIL